MDHVALVWQPPGKTTPVPIISCGFLWTFLGFCWSTRWHLNTSWYKVRVDGDTVTSNGEAETAFPERLRNNLFKKRVCRSGREICTTVWQTFTGQRHRSESILKSIYTILIWDPPDFFNNMNACLLDSFALPVEEALRRASALLIQACKDAFLDQMRRICMHVFVWLFTPICS